MPLDHTPEQLAILEAASGTRANLMISALAGTGKTTTLEAVERAVPRSPMLYLVFNKKNATEAEGRMLGTTHVRTLNGCGHRIWAAGQGRNLRVDKDKSRGILRGIIDDAPREHRDALWSVYGEVLSAVALAKALGYIPDGKYTQAKRLITRDQFHRALDEAPDDLTGDLIDAVLTRSIKLAYDGVIDFNDQVYMPALFGGTYPRYPLVLVDEYQDLSPVDHTMLERLVKGRLIGVGDPWQNIYGFRGASAGGMRQATDRYQCTPLPLSTSFRCPEAIVRHVHWRVPHFRWSSPGGQVEVLGTMHSSGITDDSTILCRNNAPLLRLGFQLLAAGRSVSIAGTDIGPRLVGTMKKLGPENMRRAEVLTAIADWEADKLDRESKTAADMAACMRVFAEHGRTLGEALVYADHLFKQTGHILLSTIHKAKGLEWSNVIHLDPWLVRRDPSEQNQNLDYVASTRSRDHLIEIDSEGIEW